VRKGVWGRPGDLSARKVCRTVRPEPVASTAVTSRAAACSSPTQAVAAARAAPSGAATRAILPKMPTMMLAVIPALNRAERWAAARQAAIGDGVISSRRIAGT